MLWLNIMECNKRSSRAFTLIELLIVIVVISILTAITLPVSKYVVRRAREAQQKIYIEKIKSALDDYRAAYGEYPITPVTNTIPPYELLNYNDVVRHYSTNYLTECHYTTNSPFTNFSFLTHNNTEEEIVTEREDDTKIIDYGLTYPLMLKQLEQGARPFMDFQKISVAALVYHPNLADDQFEITHYRKTAGGNIVERRIQAIKGNTVNRYKAIDPVTQKQWKYESRDGVTYSLTNHPVNDPRY